MIEMAAHDACLGGLITPANRQAIMDINGHTSDVTKDHYILANTEKNVRLGTAGLNSALGSPSQYEEPEPYYATGTSLEEGIYNILYIYYIYIIYTYRDIYTYIIYTHAACQETPLRTPWRNEGPPMVPAASPASGLNSLFRPPLHASTRKYNIYNVYIYIYNMYTYMYVYTLYVYILYIHICIHIQRMRYQQLHQQLAIPI